MVPRPSGATTCVHPIRKVQWPFLGVWARVPAPSAATVLFAAFTLPALPSAQTGSTPPLLLLRSVPDPLGWPHVWRDLALTGMAATGLSCALMISPELPSSLVAMAVALVSAAAVTAVTSPCWATTCRASTRGTTVPAPNTRSWVWWLALGPQGTEGRTSPR